jgi:putative ABC transport system permease protein
MSSARSDRPSTSSQNAVNGIGSCAIIGGENGAAPRVEHIRDLIADCRSALRMCRRDWRITSLACLMVAFGVGAAAAVFSVLDQVLLQPPPGVNASGNVAYLQLLAPGKVNGTSGEGISTPSFDQLRHLTTSLAGMASYEELQGSISVGSNHPIAANGNTIYGDFFEILGVRPSAGRVLYAFDTKLGEDPHRIVLSQSLTHRLFGLSSPVGESVDLNGIRYIVVGVTANDFSGVDKGYAEEFWIPYGSLPLLFGFPPADLVDPNTRMHRSILIRARSGVTIPEAQAQIATVLQRLAANSEDDARYLAYLRPRAVAGLSSPPIIRSRTRRSMSLLAAVAALVLLIVCANVSSLLLIRSLKRRATTATLLAIGASRVRIARQQLTYSTFLGLAGAVAGIPVAWAICALLKGGGFVAMPAFMGLRFDSALVVFLPLAGVLAGAVAGAIPAVLTTRFDLASALREGAATHTGQRRFLRFALSSGQLALSLTLTVGALLLLHSIRNLYSIQTGMNTDGVVALTLHHSPRLPAAESNALQRRVIAAARAVPNVREAALDRYGLPGGIGVDLSLVGAPASQAINVKMVPATPGLLGLLQIPLIDGRTFLDGDWVLGKPGGVVLTASLARRLFGAANVAGRHVVVMPSTEEPVIGVTGDIRSPGSDIPVDAFFVTYGDIGDLRIPYFTLLFRTQHPDAQTAQQVRAAVQNVLRDEAVPDARLLTTDVQGTYSEQLVLARLLSLLAVFGIVIAALGLYGFIATTVEERRREFALRAVLGANPIAISRLVASQATKIAIVGVVMGISGASALGRVLRSELFGVEPIDPLSYVLGVTVLVTAITLATASPARRAMRIELMRTLREE